MSTMDADVRGMNDAVSSIDKSSDDAVVAVAHGGRKHAEHLLRKIQMTAPVDTGEYKEDWRIDEDAGGEGEIHIVNSTEHGPFLVFPNQRMVGSPKADDPGLGIIHNVRGIVFAEQKNFRQSLIESIKRILL